VDPQDPTFEARREFLAEPVVKTRTSTPAGDPRDAGSQLRQRGDAEKHAILIDLIEPCNDARIGARSDPLRHHIGIQQKGHNLTFRTPPLSRSTFNGAPRSGDSAKNSARLPLRLALRCHSSADTTTTVSRPRLVIVWGPSANARSITSLSLAFAAATVHVGIIVDSVVTMMVIIVNRSGRTS